MITFLTPQQFFTLLKPVQFTYLHWLNSVDIKSVLPKYVYYHHRKLLLSYSIDISVPFIHFFNLSTSEDFSC